jgi:hypothetical protein
LADTIQHFYPRLVELPQVRQAILAEFGETSPSIIQAMAADGSLGSDADDVEDLLIRFLAEYASIVAEFKASGRGSNDPTVSMDYLKQHHPEAMALIEKMGGAPGFEQTDFIVQVLRYNFLYIVAAEGFEDQLFDDIKDAVSFAKDNYEPFINFYSASSTL